jgi:hypothetical protein
MLWRTSPSATELEAVVMGWLRRLIGLPDAFEGVIYDTASVSSLHAIAAARRRRSAVRARGSGRPTCRACASTVRTRRDRRSRKASSWRASAGRAAEDPVGRRHRMGPTRCARRLAKTARRVCSRWPWCDIGHDVDHERRSGGRDCRCLRGGGPLAAYRLRLRRRGGHAARARACARRRRPRGLAGGEPAQVAVRALRPERVLLPADGCRPPGLLAHARVPENARRRPNLWTRASSSAVGSAR